MQSRKLMCVCVLNVCLCRLPRSHQIMADELRRTSHLRMLVGVGVGSLEAVAQTLVNSIWSFPIIQR